MYSARGSSERLSNQLVAAMGAVSQRADVRGVALRRDEHGFSYLDCMAHMVKHSLTPHASPDEMWAMMPTGPPDETVCQAWEQGRADVAEVIGAITVGMLVRAQQDVHARRSLKRAGGFNAACLRVVQLLAEDHLHLQLELAAQRLWGIDAEGREVYDDDDDPDNDESDGSHAAEDVEDSESEHSS